MMIPVYPFIFSLLCVLVCCKAELGTACLTLAKRYVTYVPTYVLEPYLSRLHAGERASVTGVSNCDLRLVRTVLESRSSI